MAILSEREWKTDEWVGKERMYPPPDWYGASPDVIKHRGRPWNQVYSDGPWLDHDGAEKKIDARLKEGRISEEEASLLTQWARDGYFTLEGAIERSHLDLIDQYVKDLDDLWTADKPMDGLQIMSLHLDDRPPGPTDHAELLTWPLEKRLHLRDSQLWRIHYYHPFSQAGMELTKAPRVLRMACLLLDEDPVLINAIGFKWGSQVGLHQDLCAYHIHPANRLIGVWLAGEDVNPEAGPLGVYPGTHRVPLWPGWNNYPQTNLRTCHLETRDEQANYLSDAVEGIERKPLPVKKGDAIFQHPLLIHGGDKIVDRSATRFSMVIHYSVSGGDKMHKVEGPFNW